MNIENHNEIKTSSSKDVRYENVEVVKSKIRDSGLKKGLRGFRGSDTGNGFLNSGPKSLPDKPAVLPFDYELLPEKLREWIKDIAYRCQCSPDFIAMAAITSASILIGRKLTIRPKKLDDWTVVPNLWGCVIGSAGCMKSPAIAEGLKPFKKYEELAKEKHDSEVKEYNDGAKFRKIVEKTIERKIKDALSMDEDVDKLQEELLDNDISFPTKKRFIVNATTTPKLLQILSENTNGVFIFRDELIGLLKLMDSKGEEASKATYLELWDGLASITYDTLSRGTDNVESCISVFGSIQPEVFEDYLKHSPLDGFMNRFQLAVWPDMTFQKVIDQKPDSAARKKAYKAFDNLYNLDVVKIKSMNDEYGHLPFLRFNDEAQQIFINWLTQHNLKLSNNSLPSILESHFSKYRSLIPSLALIFHVIDGYTGPITKTSINRALLWDKFLESHSRKMFNSVMHTDFQKAKLFVERIESGKIDSGFTVKDVTDKGWKGLNNKADVLPVLKIVIEYNWIKKEIIPSGPRGGRPSEVYHINNLELDYEPPKTPENHVTIETQPLEEYTGEVL